MNTAKALLAVVTMAAIAACAPAPAPMAMTGTPADEQAIRDLFERVETAWNTKDAAAMTAMVTEDYNSVSPDGEHTMGRAAYGESTAAEFAGERPEGMMLSVDTAYVHWHTADVATVGGPWSVSGLPEGAPSTGSWMCVVKRTGDQWLMSNGLVASFMPNSAGGN